MKTESVSTVIFLVVAICVIAMGGILLIVYMVDGGRDVFYTQSAPNVNYVSYVPQQQLYIAEVVSVAPATTLPQKKTCGQVSCQSRIDYLEDEYAYLRARYNSLNDDYYDDEYDYDHSDSDADLIVYVEDEDGDDIEGARVEIEGEDDEVDYTDENGKAAFYNIEEDCYDVSVSESGYEDEETHVCVDDGERRGITVELQED